MKQSKHTPGPWTSNGFHDCGTLLTEIVTADNKSRIARVDGLAESNANPTPQAEANARLIASAPEMLETLDHGVNELMRAYKMTSKLEMQDHEYGAILNELVMRLNEELKTAIAKAKGSQK